jgi:hypothetical protein
MAIYGCKEFLSLVYDEPKAKAYQNIVSCSAKYIPDFVKKICAVCVGGPALYQSIESTKYNFDIVCKKNTAFQPYLWYAAYDLLPDLLG